MNWLLEQPLPIALVGGLLVAGCLAAVVQTGSVRFFYAAGGCLLLTVVLLVIESQVVTPYEEIEQTLQTIARDLETNDPPRVLAHLARSATTLRSQAESALRRVEIQRVAVKNNLQVDFQPADQPQRATARFNAVIVGSERRGGVTNQSAPWYFVVDFVREEGNWRITNYQRQSPLPQGRSRDSQ